MEANVNTESRAGVGNWTGLVSHPEDRLKRLDSMDAFLNRIRVDTNRKRRTIFLNLLKVGWLLLCLLTLLGSFIFPGLRTILWVVFGVSLGLGLLVWLLIQRGFHLMSRLLITGSIALLFYSLAWFDFSRFGLSASDAVLIQGAALILMGLVVLLAGGLFGKVGALVMAAANTGLLLLLVWRTESFVPTWIIMPVFWALLALFVWLYEETVSQSLNRMHLDMAQAEKAAAAWQQAKDELEKAYDLTLESWAYTLDLRDQETENHTRRVTDLAYKLGQWIGVSPEDLVHIRRGALLHDIGKAGIPESILQKPGLLSPEEWAIIHKHPENALKMLENIPYLQKSLDIPYAHHEKWDGSGYPRGLKGEEIPLAARIFSIVDVWEALGSDRPYREAWSTDEVKAYLLQQSSRHFDPVLVQEFLAMLQKENL